MAGGRSSEPAVTRGQRPGNRPETPASYPPGMSYRARVQVELPDRPGALAAVAAEIARLGGNVVAIDVQQVADGRVCDDLLLDLPDEVGGVDVAGALQASGVAVLVSFRPGDGTVDPVLRTMRWACAMASGGFATDELAR